MKQAGPRGPSSTELPARLTTSEVSRLTGISIQSARRLIQSGKLTVVRLPGCRPLVDRDELLELIEKSTKPAAAAGEPVEARAGNVAGTRHQSH
jgi:excisionase family DNA binding protein